MESLEDYHQALADGVAVDATAYTAHSNNNRLNDLWYDLNSWFAGGEHPTTTSRALDRSTPGALLLHNTAGDELVPMVGRFASSGVQALYLYDRLVDVGTFSGTGTDEQTTGLPTATLPRYTDGKGVLVFVMVRGGGTTNGAATITYTNQAGVSGRTGVVRLGSTGYNSSRQMLPMALQHGDTGVRSVQAWQNAIAPGGTYDIVLLKLHGLWVFNDAHLHQSVPSLLTGGHIGLLEPVHPDACLTLMGVSSVSSTGGFASSILFGRT